MIVKVLRTLINSGINEIIIIVSENHIEEFQKTIPFYIQVDSINIKYIIQHEPLGIAHAISLVEEEVNNEKFCVLLGDNIFDETFHKVVSDFEKDENAECCLFITEVDDPINYGVAELNHRGEIIQIHEKPTNPHSNIIVTGLYLYDEKVFEYINQINPSERGELEITDVNNLFLLNSNVRFETVNGFWCDAGNIKSFEIASTYFKDNSHR